MTNASHFLLTPVKQEELKIVFGYYQPLSYFINPEEVFAETIFQFKKLAVGKYFWFISDPVNWLTYSCGGMLEQMTPIKKHELVKQHPEILFNNTHPDDIMQMFAFTNYWVNYAATLAPERKAHVRPTIYLRMLNKQNEYKWSMIQYADSIEDSAGKILYGLTLLTDISHIKKEGPAQMSILDTYNESCQTFFCTDGKTFADENNPPPKITNRELEVLRFLATGLSSKQIADKLGIAIKTIDNHRQNMLHKTSCKSSGELVAYGITKGFI
jgi:DNA-binding CsgD family transcriptional regulator